MRLFVLREIMPQAIMLCNDCNVNTSIHGIQEYYMVQHELWESVAGNCEFLCIGCLEARLGRELTPEDFTNYPINKGVFPQSERLLSRIGTINLTDDEREWITALSNAL